MSVNSRPPQTPTKHEQRLQAYYREHGKLPYSVVLESARIRDANGERGPRPTPPPPPPSPRRHVGSHQPACRKPDARPKHHDDDSLWALIWLGWLFAACVCIG